MLNAIVTVLIKMHFVFWDSTCAAKDVFHKDTRTQVNTIIVIFLSNRTSHKNPWATGDMCYPILCGKAHSCTVVPFLAQLFVVFNGG